MSSDHSRSGRHFAAGYLPLFCFLSLVFLLFLAAVLLLVRKELREYCRDDVSGRLEKYLQQRSIDPLILTARGEGGRVLHGLNFVRLISENQQFFYSDSPDLKVDFEGLINLDPLRSAQWISLRDTSRKGQWTVQSISLGNGFMVQAGRKHPDIVDLYSDLLRIVFIMAILSLVMAGVLTGICRSKSLVPLRRVEDYLRKITDKNEDPRQDYDDDAAAGLYQLFDGLTSRNRRLIQEMQESLDNVAHDLRTPMTRLRSVAEYGLQQNSPEKLAEALSDCLEESERVLSMLGIMMSVAEAESGTMRLSREPVQLYSTISDVFSLYEYVADEKNIELQMNIDPQITIEVDRMRITQVWANIVDNAIKYGRKGGYVRISMRTGEGGVTVIFEDNGMGISENEQERIWERLFRGDRSRSRPGLGLGLNYVRAVVEAHGGRVGVTSTLEGGTSFAILLPLP